MQFRPDDKEHIIIDKINTSMAIKLLLGAFILIACFGPSMMLVSGALREIKENKEEVIKLKLNTIDIINNFFLNGLTFGLSQTLFFWLVFSPPYNFSPWFFIIIIPFVFLASIDFIILISHIINEKSRTIFWDKKQNVFKVSQNGKEFQINLNSETLEIAYYYPPRQGNYRGFPGFSFHVLVLSDNNEKLRISSITFDNYNFFLPLSEHKNYTVIERQFNVLI